MNIDMGVVLIIGGVFGVLIAATAVVYIVDMLDNRNVKWVDCTVAQGKLGNGQ